MTTTLHVGTRKGLFTVARNGRSWEVTRASLLGDPVSMVLRDRAGTLHAAQDLGHFGAKMKRSTDDGATWTEAAVPQYPEKPEGLEDNDPMRGTPIPWALKMVWSLEQGARDNELWCGTIPGGLFRSTDGGESWALNENLWRHPGRKQWMGGGADLPGIHSILVDPRDGDTIRIGVSCGGMWTTRDCGDTWAVECKGLRAAYAPPEHAYEPNGQDAHRLAQCRAAPDTIWIQHHNGIFKSTDSGMTCSELVDVEPSVFGFAVVVHPEDPDSAWFVPGVKDEFRYPVDGALVVNRTRDGGKTFETLRSGLPQSHAYDLIYRHGLDIDGSGDRLAFGSTTGNLWISENQGDDWTQVSANLPPIYCVRFAD